MMYDKIEKIGKSLVQHGPNNDRIYLKQLHKDDLTTIAEDLYNLAILKRYTKIIAKVPEGAIENLIEHNYRIEASIPGLYQGRGKGYFLAHFFGAKRSFVPKQDRKLSESILKTATEIFDAEPFEIPKKYHIRKINKSELGDLAKLYRMVSEFYPLSIFKEKYLNKFTDESTTFLGIYMEEKLVAAASIEIDENNENAQLDNFVTHSEHVGRNLTYFLLRSLENVAKEKLIKTLYSMVPASSHGINKVFGRYHYHFGGTLINNTLIGDTLQSMNVWHKKLK